MLQIVCLNLHLDGVTLDLDMRRPFDSLVEGPLVHIGRDNCPQSERQRDGSLWVEQFTQALAGEPEPHLLMAQRLLREVA